jgi:hypothetical protein
MNDQELLLQGASAPTIYFDGFGAYRKINGVMRCIGWTYGLGAQYNLIVSLAGAERSNRDHRRALDGEAATSLAVWSGSALAH